MALRYKIVGVILSLFDCCLGISSIHVLVFISLVAVIFYMRGRV